MIKSTCKYTSWNIRVAPKCKKRRPSGSQQTRKEQGQDFRRLYASLGFSTDDAAQLLQVSRRTIHNWTSGTVPVPYMAVKLMRLHLRYELPGKAWEGWHLSAGRLYTPEGFELAPHEVSWWSLLVRQARLFRVLLEQSRQKQAEAPSGRLAAPVGAEARSLLDCSRSRKVVRGRGTAATRTACQVAPMVITGITTGNS